MEIEVGVLMKKILVLMLKYINNKFIKISNMEKIFRREKSRTSFDGVASKQLRKSRIFYHKNIDVKEARRLFDDAINTDICTRIVTPNLTEFVYSKNGIVKHQAQF